jgi:uncharacterized protein (DUF305 family)
MRTRFITMGLVVLALGLAACGSDDEATTESSAANGNAIDRAFVADMIPHHESAIEMARIARERGESEFVKTLAENIIRTQSAEIKTLEAEDAQLEEEGVEVGDLGVPEHMSGMSMDIDSLESAEPFDTEFMTMMIEHHESAVTMARVETEKGSDPELVELAHEIIEAQEKEISDMRAELGEEAPSDMDMEGHGTADGG